MVAISLTVTAVTTTIATAQGFPPKTVANLQVLPKNTPPAAVIDLMKEFTQALGVRCDHCHVGVDGQPLSTFDFTADLKTPKATARSMMRLVGLNNAALDTAVPGGPERVRCWTCHAGQKTPRRR